MTIGEKIKQRRIELGMSQEELAERCNLTNRSSISKMEASVNGISLKKLSYYRKL